MPTAVVTGAGGLIGAECVRAFVAAGFDVIGIDNDMRRRFFGPAASTQAVIDDLTATLGEYRHAAIDIRDEQAVDRVFARAPNLELIVHAAAQPSHDWAASDPRTDFGVNAVGTMNLLEATRRHAPDATFVFMSTNKVYGDLPNHLPLVELETRLELDSSHPYAAHGIDDSMSIDRSLHSLFGVSKASADLMVQEYGRYFGMPTVCFRGGCLTGPAHAGAQLHGFLSYLMRCATTGEPYTVFGHGGKQVRDNLHSADVVAAFLAFHADPEPGCVFNLGGGRHSNCSVLEAISLCEPITGRELAWQLDPQARKGDHMWWISDLRPFQARYPSWTVRHGIEAILREIYERNADRWAPLCAAAA
ncbi:MAG: CDP-paratose 2-epimerase [Solirubrobacteraceae bacterium]|jgi:CDP-paratose 2-epimerase|nr:CDP-paratose 2-epimerase [Solirubrobacteraceae bacterium]